MNRLIALRLPLVVVTFVVLAHTSFASTPIDGVHIDLMALLVSAVAVVGGREVAVVVGFVAGLATDAFLTTPFGLSSFAFAFVGYVLGEVERFGRERSLAVNALLIAGGSAAIQVVMTVGLYLLGLGNPLQHRILIEVGVVTGVNFVLSPVALLIVRFALPTVDTSSASINRRRL
jgi:rod shape-determining protein MreD